MRKHYSKIISFLIIISSVTYIYGGEVARDNKNGFEIISKEYIESMEAELISYQHSKTGARLIQLKNSDPNKVFAIGFKTPVDDNTGVNHIVEHAVFTGSEKYDIKDVFFEMKKKSPNTFMNASTAVDMTIYPFSTRNLKDYNNLMDVYLDAVFFPNLQKHRHGFDQEGWHYSIDDNNKYHINGVVYNEMKGASVAPRRILAMANRRAMYPDTMYIYNAGGNPDEIPNLSYRRFKKTHKKYYLPSNSCAFIYGDVETDKVLAKLNDYYSKFRSKNQQDICQYQRPFIAKKYYTDYYPAIGGNDNYYLSSNFAVGKMEDTKLQISMEILMDILTSYEDSPLRKVLAKSQTSKTLSYDIDSAIAQPMYSLIRENVKKEDISYNERLIEESLKRFAKKGFSNELINKSINNYEKELKENLSDISKGIDMAYSLIYGWGHGVCPSKLLKAQETIDEIKKEADSKFFQDLLSKYMIDNNHKSQVVLAPDESYIERYQNKENKALIRQEKSNNRIRRSFTINNKAKLEKWQEEKDPIGQLPKLSLEDISQGVDLPKLTCKSKDKLYYLADTHDLIYADLYFDTSYIPQESLNELFLFSHLINQKATSKLSLYKGDIRSSIMAISQFDDYNKYSPKLRLSLQAEEENLEEGFQILNEIINNNKWDDKWVLSQIEKISTHYKKFLTSNPLELVELSVYNSKQGANRYEYEKIISFYDYICQIEEDYPSYKEKLISKLEIINNSIFNKNNIILGATLEDKNIGKLEEAYKAFTNELDDKIYPRMKYSFQDGEKRQGFEIPSDVQYIAWGGNYKEKGGEYRGDLYVLSNILNSDYMLNNIRVKNGAYGAGIRFTPYGDVDIYTYQDPKLLESLETIENIPNYLKSLNLDKASLDEYKIGALSRFESELGLNENPLVIGRTLQAYQMGGLTNNKLREIKKQILETSIEDIRAQALLIDKLLEDKRYSVAASKKKLVKHTNYFDIIR